MHAMAAASSTVAARVTGIVSAPDGGAVAARVGAADPGARPGIDGDAVGMAGQLAPRTPAAYGVATPFQLGECRLGEAAFQAEQVARVAEDESPGEPARRLHRLLDVRAPVDEGGVDLEMDLGLAVGAHAAEHLPQSPLP